MRILLIINHEAGGRRRKTLDLLKLSENFSGHTLSVVAPSAPEETVLAAQRGVAEGYDRIFAAGGDGTIHRVVQALAGTPVQLGVIPIGTVNVLARELGIPLNPTHAFNVAMYGQSRLIDVGIANGRPFVLMAGLGFDADVVSRVVPAWKGRVGPLAYISAGFQAQAHFKPSLFHLTLDGNSVDVLAWLMVVGNASYYAYRFSLNPDARVDDGWLDVMLFAEQSALDRITQFGAIFMGQHTHHPNVRHYRVHTLSLTADPPVAMQLDGEMADVSPIEMRIHRRALSVMVPHPDHPNHHIRAEVEAKP